MTLVVLFLFGCTAGFFSGLLGIGGGITLIPLLVYVAPALGVVLEIHHLTTLSLIFILFAGLSGSLLHHRFGALDKDLLLWLGIGSSLGALGGGIIQAYLPERAVIGIFAAAATFTGASMLTPQGTPNETTPPYSPVLAIAVSLVAGLGAATAGVGGAFLLLPFMTLSLKVPLRTAIGTSLPLVVIAALFSLPGRFGLLETDWLLGVPLVLGAIPGAHLGTLVSHKLPTHLLRRIFALLVLLMALRMGLTAFT